MLNKESEEDLIQARLLYSLYWSAVPLGQSKTLHMTLGFLRPHITKWAIATAANFETPVSCSVSHTLRSSYFP